MANKTKRGYVRVPNSCADDYEKAYAINNKCRKENRGWNEEEKQFFNQKCNGSVDDMYFAVNYNKALGIKEGRQSGLLIGAATATAVIGVAYVTGGLKKLKSVALNCKAKFVNWRQKRKEAKELKKKPN